MKLSEYAAQHANDGKKIDAKTYVAASTMIGETFEVKDWMDELGVREQYIVWHGDQVVEL